MAPSPDLQASGDRIERLLEELRVAAGPRWYGQVEELLGLVTDLYGGALIRIMELARRQAPTLIDAMGADEVIGSLLLVHGLHPESLERRVAAALDRVRPLLAAHSGDVALVAVDEEAGAVLLRLLGTCDGCPSSSITLKQAVEQAIVSAAPEIGRIDVDDQSASAGAVPVTLGAKPVFEACPAAGG
jgi:Fe-S cluster biogenesis protein NfuA